MVWSVYLCGATDCFWHASFADASSAIKWAEENSRNPEGYLIKQEDDEEFITGD